jgi:hypothetical protein
VAAWFWLVGGAIAEAAGFPADRPGWPSDPRQFESQYELSEIEACIARALRDARNTAATCSIVKARRARCLSLQQTVRILTTGSVTCDLARHIDAFEGNQLVRRD